MSEEKKEFTVKDRRFFSEEAASPEVGGEEPKPVSDKPGEETPKAKREAAAENIQLPEINFQTFILSLNSSALVHLGVIADPATGESDKNLPLAKQVIDMLSMLEEKTRGNLTEDESGMLKSILYELRIIYVKEKR